MAASPAAVPPKSCSSESPSLRMPSIASHFSERGFSPIASKASSSMVICSAVSSRWRSRPRLSSSSWAAAIILGRAFWMRASA